MKLALASAGALLLQATHHAQDDLLYDEIAQRWLERNALQESTVESTGPSTNVAALLECSFTHLALGVFDVYLPPSALHDGKALETAGAALRALIETQRAFGSWVQGAEVQVPGKNKRKDDVLAKWLDGLTPKLCAGKDAAGADLSVVAGADESVRTALQQFRTEQRKGDRFGLERELAGVPLALFPKRAEFVEFTCVAGAIASELRASAWNEGVLTWLEYQADRIPFLTLEYAAATGGGDFEKGVSVGARNPAALSQLVTQVACRALLASVFSDGLDPALGSGMANALVIDLYGELDTRIDGDVRSRSSQGRSLFVPGGNPNGGVLPPTSAENRWRGTKGKDHFVGILAQVQEQSGKKGKSRAEKLAHFELLSDDGARRELVSAPFLGASAVKPSQDVFGDYLELVRCYGVAFLHWLRLEGAGKPAESATRFGEFLRTLARGVKTEDLPKVLHGLYGQPLSAESVHGLFDGPTLEGRFLAWLGRKG